MIEQIINYLKNSYQINPIWQIIGFIWFGLSVIAFLNKDDKKIKIIHSISLSFWWIHFFMIWLYTAVAVDLIWMIRNFLSVKYKWNIKILFLLIIMYILFGFLTFKNIYSFLPVISWIFASFAFFKLHWIKMRLILLSCSFAWLIYNLLWYSIWWIITEIFLEISLIITISRLFLDRKNNKINLK